MAYTCYDCSYKGKRSSATGHCPACGSLNIKGSGNGEEEKPRGRRRIGLIVAIALWGWLIGHIGWKLLGQ